MESFIEPSKKDISVWHINSEDSAKVFSGDIAFLRVVELLVGNLDVEMGVLQEKLSLAFNIRF